MKQSSLGVVALALVGIIGSGVSSCNPDPGPLPTGVYGLSSETPPDRAKMLTSEQFDAISSSPRFFNVTSHSAGDQDLIAARQEKEDDKTIDDYLEGHRSRGLKMKSPVPPQPKEKGVKRRVDGSFSHKVPLNHGAQVEVATLSQRWAKSTMARAMARFATRDNQLAVYRVFHAAVSEKARRELNLPAPDHVARDEQTYPVATIRVLIDRVASRNPRDLAPAVSDADLARMAPARCDDEEGATSDHSDRSGNKEDDLACRPKAAGIFKNYEFAAKPGLTCVKDQASRGSCVAFATASAFESVLSAGSQRWYNLSEQQLYEHAKLVWFRQDFSDGLNVSMLLYWMKSQGQLGAQAEWRLPLENAWHYNPSSKRREDATNKRYSHSCDGYDGTCSNSSHQAEINCTDREQYRYCGFFAQEGAASGFKLADYGQIWDWADKDAALRRMIALVQLGQPIVLSFSVTPAFDAAPKKGGYLAYSGADEDNRGGHAMHIVGYIDNATLKTLVPTAPAGSGGGYAIVKNSWSNCWGDGGYVYMPYDFLRSYTLDMSVVKGVSQ